MSGERILVTRGDVCFEATVRFAGHRSKATHFAPAEFPTPEIDCAWVNGVLLRADLLPDEVTDEILHRAVDPKYGYGRDEAEEI